MKKKLFLGLLAAAAVSFTACQKDEVLNEVQQDEAISFSTYLGRGAQTKGSIVEEDDLQGLGFGVFAYYTEQKFTGIVPPDGEAYDFSTGPNFMNNVQVTYQSGEWKYTGTKYWPNTPGDKISFYAYGPYDDDPTNDPTNDTQNAISIATPNRSAPVLTYEVSTNITKHMDVLFTPAQKDKTKTDDDVKMTFYHALSRIGFTVQALETYSEEITLKSVKLTGKFYESGTMNLATATASSTTNVVNGVSVITHTIDPGWSAQDQSAARDFTISAGTNGIEASTTATQVGSESDYIMIIPQTFEGSDSDKITLTAVYTVGEIENTVSKDIEGLFTFEAGKAYTFAIKIGLKTVDFDANVVAWDETPGSTDVEIK